MTNVLEGLQPKEVFQYFEEITRIPRGSGNEKQISDYLVQFAKDQGLDVIQDGAMNVIIKKPGASGYENAPAVIIQGHMDMVCEKNQGTTHDFDKDPIKLRIDGDFIATEGTTLGADNGIAVAYGLALLAAKDIPHPPLEVMITTDEEVGMKGAAAVDPAGLQGKILINIDSEEEGKLWVSCAGGLKATLHLPVKREAAPEGMDVYSLKIRGLKGGHSGAEIHKQRANSNKLMGRVLNDLAGTFTLSLEQISGGAKDNAIPREADAVFLVPKEESEALKKRVEQWENIFQKEFQSSDPGISLSVETPDRYPAHVFCKDTLEKIMAILVLMPNGVQTMSMEIEGLVESSTNIGVVITREEEVVFISAVRSSVKTLQDVIHRQMEQIAKLVGGNITIHGEYPAWEYNRDSKIRRIFEEVYTNLYGKKPDVKAIHAGLECGIFAKKIEGVDMISFGPNMWDIHTPDEKLSITSAERTWNYLLAVLKEIR